MLTAIRRFKAARRAINGRPRRSDKGSCPFCRAQQREWCKSDCTAIDPMDYR